MELTHPPLSQIKLAETLVNSWLEEAARDKKRFEFDAINWADLRVVECLWTIDTAGDRGYVITISEASEDSQRLRSYLFDKWKASEFCGHDVIDVRFVFEW